MNFIKENKKAIFFLLTFIGVYLVLNTLYGFYVRYYMPASDLLTRAVTGQVVWLLGFFDPSVTYYPSSMTEYIPVGNDRQNMIYVFEGCNGVNVIIVYFSFLVAFTGPWRALAKFTGIGIVAIHFINLLRIGLLYGVASHFPEQLYFFHKYFFTGIIYIMVFILWYLWVRHINANDANQP